MTTPPPLPPPRPPPSMYCPYLCLTWSTLRRTSPPRKPAASQRAHARHPPSTRWTCFNRTTRDPGCSWSRSLFCRPSRQPKRAHHRSSTRRRLRRKHSSSLFTLALTLSLTLCLHLTITSPRHSLHSLGQIRRGHSSSPALAPSWITVILRSRSVTRSIHSASTRRVTPGALVTLHHYLGK